MDKKPFIKKTVVMMAFQLAITMLVLIFFLFFSYRTAREKMEGDMKNLLQIYGQELDNKVDNASRILERLIYNNTDYDMLQSANEADRYYAAMNLKNLIEESITYETYVDALVIADSQYGTCLDKENGFIRLGQRTALRDFALEKAKEGRVKAEWNIEEIGEETYLYKMYVWQGRATGIFMSVEHFMKTAANGDFEEMSLLLADRANVVQGCYGSEITAQKIGTPIQKIRGNVLHENAHSLAGGSMTLYAYVGMSQILKQIGLNMVGMMIVILMSVVFTLYLIWNMRRQIIGPMRNMTESMEKIGRGDYELRISTEYSSREFSILRDTFNRLMNEIVGLKIKSYERQIALQETELKCVKLQIRPHFFLNAMTTISSLSIQGRNEEIKTYIDALSKNIRYMFKSGLHTVSLGEEIRHVENYFEMQELKYPACVFYYIEMVPELEDWPVPQMLVHTIIENEYKYAIALGQTLTILIKAEKREREGEEMLYLEIEDDGKGYPQEVLEQFAGKGAEASKDGSRVGLWSLRRMMELMYDRENLFLISNVEPHGCVNCFWIPARPVHEVKTEQIKID